MQKLGSHFVASAVQAALEEAILKGAERSPDWTIPVGSIPAMADFSDVDSPREGQGTVESFQAVACASMDGSPCTEQQPREAHGREPSNRGEQCPAFPHVYTSCANFPLLPCHQHAILLGSVHSVV